MARGAAGEDSALSRVDMVVTFDIVKWAAWAPGMTRKADWLAWSHAPFPVVGLEAPTLIELPSRDRRRIDRLSRMVFQVARWVQQDVAQLPLVFASRHGDAARLFELMVENARGEPLSPLGFASSVHNGVARQYSILRRDPSNVVAVSNGRFTVEAGVLEALTLARQAMVVVYDASPHPTLAPWFPETASDFAYAWLVQRGGPLTLRTVDAAAAAPEALPHALEVLRFYLSGEPRYRADDELGGYEWSRARSR